MIFPSIACLIALILVIAYTLYVNYKDRKLIELVTPITRGNWAERRLVLRLLKAGINPKAIFHDLYIRKPNGEYTQIDAVVATSAGLIVFEVKHYSGWIFGNSTNRYWTQILAYGRKKHRFYNPIMQNEGHIRAIRKCLLENPGIPIYSVVVFFGRCELKSISCYAENTAIIYPSSITKVVKDILAMPNAQYGNKHEIMNVFTQAVQNGNDEQIVLSQMNTATYYGRNTPQSRYYISLGSLFRFRGFPFNKRFW